MSSEKRLVGTDETDSRCFPVPFDEAHRDGVPHRGSHIEIEDAAGRLLVCQRADDGRLEILGGHADWLEAEGRPESYEETALRELVEELNLPRNWNLTAAAAADRLRGRLIPTVRFVNQLPSTQGNNNEWIVAFRLRWDPAWGDPPSFVLSKENRAARWVEFPQLVKECSAARKAPNAALRLFLARRHVLIPWPV